MSASATAPATPAAEDVHATVDIAASPERVFEALTDPRELAAWWGTPDTYRTDDWQIDAREGGRWSARTTDIDGNVGTLEGELVVVDAPHVLEYTWRASGDAHETTVRYELAPALVRGRSGTRVTVHHTGFAALDVRARAGAWSHALGRLAERTVIVCTGPAAWRRAA